MVWAFILISCDLLHVIRRKRPSPWSLKKATLIHIDRFQRLLKDFFHKRSLTLPFLLGGGLSLSSRGLGLEFSRRQRFFRVKGKIHLSFSYMGSWDISLFTAMRYFNSVKRGFLLLQGDLNQLPGGELDQDGAFGDDDCYGRWTVQDQVVVYVKLKAGQRKCLKWCDTTAGVYDESHWKCWLPCGKRWGARSDGHNSTESPRSHLKKIFVNQNVIFFWWWSFIISIIQISLKIFIWPETCRGEAQALRGMQRRQGRPIRWTKFAPASQV